MQLSATKTNFTAGEIAPDLLGRGDLRAFQNGASRLRNVFVAPTGGVRRRPGLAYLDTLRGPGRLVAFEFNTEQVYLLVFTAGWMDVYADGVKRASLATPWSAAQLGQLNWTQSADTLLVVHPDVPPQKITRTSHANWSISGWSFFEEGGRTFQPAHKFAGAEVTLTPSGTTGAITLGASAAVFQAGHVGLRFLLGGKQVTITGLSSATSASATVNQTLASTAATKDWEEPAFSAVRGWPLSVCFHQDRLVIGGSRDLPNRLWLSKSSDLFNFDLGTGLDDEAIEFALLSDQVNAIRQVFSGRHLQVFTSGAEWMVSGQPLTPSNIQLLRQTRVGSPVDRTVPVRDIDGATVFVGRSGRDLREFLFADVEQAYQATDLAMLAGHLLDQPVDQDYDQSGRLLHLVMADGSLATVTNYRAEQVTAWARQTTDGAFRSVAVAGADTCLIVERGNAFLLERFDAALSLDAALGGNDATPQRQWSGLGHLNGRTVTVLADQGEISTATVTGEAIALADPATTIQAGLPFVHEIVPLPPMLGERPASAVRLVQATFRVLETAALLVDTGQGAQAVPLKRLGAAGLLDTGPPAFTGDLTVRAVGWRRGVDQPLWRIAQDLPLPCTILSVTTDMKASD